MVQGTEREGVSGDSSDKIKIVLTFPFNCAASGAVAANNWVTAPKDIGSANFLYRTHKQESRGLENMHTNTLASIGF